jgi:hypothetical protein
MAGMRHSTAQRLGERDNGIPAGGAARADGPADGPAAEVERIRRAAVGAVAEALRRRGYEEVTFPFIAHIAGVDVWDVRLVFHTRAELVLAALRPPPGQRPGRAAFERHGGEIVARYLEFWEAGDNTVILRAVFGAAVVDRRLAAAIEARTIAALIQPFVERVPTTDAYPRARLAFSHLLGLGISRYLLRQEPLASADYATIAIWAGPALDYFLRGELGRDYVAAPTQVSAAVEPQRAAVPRDRDSEGLQTVVIASGPRVVDDPLRWLDDEARRASPSTARLAGLSPRRLASRVSRRGPERAAGARGTARPAPAPSADRPRRRVPS